MPLSFTVDASQVNQRIDSLAAAIESERARRNAAEDIIDGIMYEFDTAGRGRWEPLADSTIAHRRGTSAQILVDTGFMRGSLLDAEAVHITVDEIVIGSGAAYEVYHTSHEPRTKIPLRDFYDIDERFKERASQSLLDGIMADAGAK